MRKRASINWANDIGERLRFERGAKAAFPDLQCTSTGRGRGGYVVYTMTVDVPYYEPRHVTLVIGNATRPYFVRATVDGPTESPHRFDLHQLCIWRPRDPPEQTWVGDDGLLALIDHARVHLFKEAYWRETKIWPGSEAPHGPTKSTHAAEEQDDAGPRQR